MDPWSERRGLYAIVDPELCRGRQPLAIAEQILSGGCAVLQLRSKRIDPAALEPLARDLRALCLSRGVPFVINDHVALALRVGADGVHLGQGDLPIEQARMLAPGLAIGLSTHSAEQARDAQARGADLIGFGPIFATASKRDPDPVVGLDQLHAVCAEARIPVVAIGGITAANARDVARTGAAMGAAISALCAADAPAEAAAQMQALLIGGSGR